MGGGGGMPGGPGGGGMGGMGMPAMMRQPPGMPTGGMRMKRR